MRHFTEDNRNLYVREGYCFAHKNVRLDAEGRCPVCESMIEEFNSLPDCPCGWRGEGTGPDGQIVRGDRCPRCGNYLW